MMVSQAAVLTEPRKIERKNVPIPDIGEDEIQVKVERCCICGTDVHGDKNAPFSLPPWCWS